MKYTIYKITNKINSKIYIGKHQTKDLNDGYMGSGKMLRRAQRKYGIENFIKEILHVFDTEEEMNSKERELVTYDFCLREDTYNICVGGKGGFSYINSVIRSDPNSDMEKRRTDNIRSYNIKNGIKPPLVEWTQERRNRVGQTTRELIAKGAKRNYFKENNPLNDPVIRAKHKEAVKANSKGSKNSQYGSMWITDGITNKKIKSVDIIPDGWYKGRVVQGAAGRSGNQTLNLAFPKG